ncbi:double-stranded RNA-binding protein 8 isoform X2 [Populus trichocarpa]|uniref:double-stranded RNA-binding protein 8 isoform X2 n=1 Tax=Populus trichocarpa TaxID=3694 RepID=UPI0022785567|nr:double-stranded RNA-binding protein 8 isoform X2 [Populus trichocarpa]
MPLKRSREQGTPTMYKSNLQAVCQQRGWELPTYQVTKQGQDHSPLFSATVTVNATSFSSPSPSSSSKKAQSEAAKLAYDHFSLISSPSASLSVSAGSTGGSAGKNTRQSNENPTPLSNTNPTAGKNTRQSHENPTPLSNANPTAGKNTRQSHDNPTPLSKTNPTPLSNKAGAVAKTDESFGGMFKNQLQTYAQKRNFTLPVYSCERLGPPHAIQFKCKVTVNGQTYESREYFPTLNKAENAAAKAALMSLLPNGVEEDKSGYKNLLQDMAQREGCGLPTYFTEKSGEAHAPTFISTVEIDGVIFTGKEARTKKQAEMSAAKTAYTARRR